jgi:hypothetical protein
LGLVGFGQPEDGIIQMAYVVRDIHAAMRAWVGKLRVGPWFLLDHFGGGRVAYMDTTRQLPGFVELIELGGAFEPLFSRFYRAGIGWDGADPVRSFI